MSVLNQALYNRLQDVFGEVRVYNEGDPFLASNLRGSFAVSKFKKNRSKLSIISPGEYYSVCCPLCGDTRFRLWINHMWNVRYLGHSLKHLVCCYNEGCQDLEGFQDTLDELLSPSSLTSLVRPVLVTERPTEEIEFPGTAIPLTELPSDHNVITYLRETRGLDITELSDYWGVKWLIESQHNLISDTNRLIFPVYSGGKLVAWQTRWFDYERNTPVPPYKTIPKYLTQGHKNRVVYNLDGVRGSDWVMIGEGTIDAIKVGPKHGICIFGKSLSARQAELIYTELVAKGTKIILALDPDLNEKDWTRLQARTEGWKNLYTLTLPSGTDPATYSREQLIRFATGGSIDA